MATTITYTKSDRAKARKLLEKIHNVLIGTFNERTVYGVTFADDGESVLTVMAEDIPELDLVAGQYVDMDEAQHIVSCEIARERRAERRARERRNQRASAAALAGQ